MLWYDQGKILKDRLMKMELPFGFRQGSKVLCFRFDQTSTKSTDVEFGLMVFLSLQFFK